MLAAEGGDHKRIADFIHWVKVTPHGSLSGDSKVAYAAQVRILDQLAWFLEGKDDYLNAAVDYALARPLPPPEAP